MKLELLAAVFITIHMCIGEIPRSSETNLGSILKSMTSGQEYLVRSGYLNYYEPLKPVKDLNNITLKGMNDTTATITCKDNVSLTFINISFIAFKNIEFVECGGAVDATVSTGKYSQYTQEAETVLIFIECNTVSIVNVYMSQNRGSALMFFNSDGHVKIQDVHIVDCVSCRGIFLYFSDQINQNNCTFKIILFVLNTSHGQSDCQDVEHDGSFDRYSFPKSQAQGLTVFFKQKNFSVDVELLQSDISNNFGCFSSGISALFFDQSNQSTLYVSNSKFENNIISSNSSNGGSSLFVEFSGMESHSASSKNFIPVHIENTSVANHTGKSPFYFFNKGIKVSAVIEMENITFYNNTSDSQGICMSFLSLYDLQTDNANIQVKMSKINAYNNGPSSVGLASTDPLAIPLASPALFSFINLDTVEITCEQCNTDDYSFRSNSASVFLGIATDFVLGYNLLFIENTAVTGACFQLHSFSHIFLSEKAVNITFKNNMAKTVGGVIASFSEGTTFSMCFLQIAKRYILEYTLDYNNSNIHLEFGNNKAQFGNDIYGNQVYRCYFAGGEQNNTNAIISFYSQTFHPYNKTNIVSKPFIVGREPSQDKEITVFPGSQFNINLTVTDHNKNSVAAYIFTSASTSEMKLSKNAFSYSGKNYQSFNSIVYSHPGNFTLYFSTLSDEREKQLKVTMIVKNCPMGFRFNPSSKTCQCYDFIKHDLNLICSNGYNISNSSRSKIWISCTLGKNITKCRYTRLCITCYLNHTIDLTKKNNFCKGRRVGNVCGSCPKNLSVLFGTSDCQNCRNKLYLLMIPVLGIIGILLVVGIYILKLTLNYGTLGGVIFYANFIRLGEITYMSQLRNINTHTVSQWFINSVNLDIAYPLCFFEGMNDLHKQLLQFVFPMYMWLIVLSIVYISRCSTRVSNLTSHLSVQVLVTLLNLTFAKLLVVVIESYSFTKLYSEDIPNEITTNSRTIHVSYVWLFSGDIEYGQGLHLLLLIIAGMIALFILLPYSILSVFAPFLYCHPWVNKLKPAFDTLYAPYQDKYRYWFGLRLITLWAISINFAITDGLNSKFSQHIQATIMIIYTILLIWQQPFKHSLLNALEIWYSVNLTFCVILDIHSLYESTQFPALKKILIFLAFSTFCLTIIYHVLLSLNLVCKIHQLIINCYKKIKIRVHHRIWWAEEEGRSDHMGYGSVANCEQTQLRESLLSIGSLRE